jgi:hypothetical protein
MDVPKKVHNSTNLKEKKDIQEVIYVGMKILKAIDYFNTSIFKIGKNFYLDRSNINRDIILLME